MSHHASLSPIHCAGMQFVNAEGQAVILRGVNTTGNAKVPPFRGIDKIEQLQVLRECGFNCVRLLFIWEALEAERGQYAQDYLDYYEQLVRWCAEAGLYVIVDFHQDGLSRYLLKGCGEGFPRWTIPPALRQYEPRNDERCKHWGLMATIFREPRLENIAAWNAFYADEEGARTGFMLMLRKVAQTLVRYPHVLGYDVLNEPFGTDAQLSALYADAGVALRSVHPQAILFCSPQAIYSAALTTPTLPRPAFDNVAFAGHYYDAGVIMLHKWFGLQPRTLLKKLMVTARQWNAPFFLGEFGAPAGTWRGQAYMQALYQWLDEHQASGAQWCYTPQWCPQRKDGWNTEDLSIVDNQGQWRANFVRPFKASER